MAVEVTFPTPEIVTCEFGDLVRSKAGNIGLIIKPCGDSLEVMWVFKGKFGTPCFNKCSEITRLPAGSTLLITQE